MDGGIDGWTDESIHGLIDEWMGENIICVFKSGFMQVETYLYDKGSI